MNSLGMQRHVGLMRQDKRAFGCHQGRPYISHVAAVVAGPVARYIPARNVNIQQTAAAAGVQPVPDVSIQQPEKWPGVEVCWCKWRGHNIRYERSTAGRGEKRQAIVLVHGFGGNADHWRKNTPVLGAAGYDVFAIDLLGYGYSDKPDPSKSLPNTVYNFGVWGAQLCDFIEEVVGQPSHLICNSVGGLSGLEAAIARPDLVKGVQLLDISLRALHMKRTNPLVLPLLNAFQRLLRETPLGAAFFASVAKAQTVKSILQQAYGDKSAVTDELVDCILTPGLRPGATAVFLDFISYSSGPLPEDLIAASPCPVSIIWGESDPWEDVVLGRKLFASLPPVCEFITLPGVGHCPQDEAPNLVNPLITAFVTKYP
eukprot:CAMPEP_0119102830 /NCGR_PEP_ID=MMETSP1180-20130426/1445_1 /TAXON_ID=3052 ORGANISM="Chlamydomonas cf sp, Strain CCMP681" /NCGR_SAMPLE_ID=MMETSP1180 /ASSEMBLY_ACC=CAM_ASM_000741 /LENGTH=370 /DNA_ID=CAMNT_0007087191 /DNA_START=6 /DNA_END=1118 /DNA_ORIENTATION=+